MSTRSNVEGYIIRVLSAEEMQASISKGRCDPLEELINQVHPCENPRKLSGGKFRETWMKCNLIRFRNFGASNWQKCGPGVNGVIRLICVISLLPEAAEKPEPRIAVVCQFWVCTQPSLSSAQSAQIEPSSVVLENIRDIIYSDDHMKNKWWYYVSIL